MSRVWRLARSLAVAPALGALLLPTPAFAQEEDVHADGATQSDLAFQGSYAYAGTYSGLRVIDISDPANARQVAFEPCNGGQFDVSVWVTCCPRWEFDGTAEGNERKGVG